MKAYARLPALSDITAGQAVFRNDMPVWLGRFGDDIWPFIESTSPLYIGPASSSFVWRDYVEGKGATLGHPSSFSKTTYEYCLTDAIVADLKISAVIHGYFPQLIKHARARKEQLDPKTVRGRIEELAKFLSMVINEGKRRLHIQITRLSDIPFALLKETIPQYPGRSEHLRRALKLISDPMVQRNLSAPLQWGLLDIEKSSIAWGESKYEGGIPTLPDAQFLFLLDYCKHAMTRFKSAAALVIHDKECQSLASSITLPESETLASAMMEYYDFVEKGKSQRFRRKHRIPLTVVNDIISEGHLASLLLILLLTGMRATETHFLMRDCLTFEHGYWFLVSKQVKHRPKDVPICEGWLAVDLTRDAYDVLMFITEQTGNPYLFSSSVPGKAETGFGYRGGVLNTKFERWLARIDVDGLFTDWTFSVHQCRETLVAQLANQEVGLPFISMQLKHFHSQFNAMPNAVTAGYGNYRQQLMTSVTTRIAEARETALLDLFGEDAKFAGGGGAAHKARIDTFFAGLGLFGNEREQYIKDMAKRGVKLMPTSIGACGRNFAIPNAEVPPCYGDYQCDPECPSHVITQRAAQVLTMRREHAHGEAERETNPGYKTIWLGLVQTLDKHIATLDLETVDD
ncbi:site-specific integrase [Burkholderia cepacia]|nr:site-specific integrase [Burkholderia cepacia]